MAPRIDGLDVSHWNTLLDPDAVPDLSLMSCKATEGRSFVSPALEIYAALFKKKNARYQGVYHWIRTDSSVVAQIENLVRAMKSIGWLDNEGALRQGKLIQLDWERTFSYPKDGPPVALADPTVNMIEDWVGRVRQQFGDRVIVYCSDWMPNFIAWRDRNPSIPLWYANYKLDESKTGGRKECEKYGADVWQWGSKGKVAGFEGGIDVNEILNTATLDRITLQPGGPPPLGIEQEFFAEEGGSDVSTHRWSPKGFHNQFEMPGCLPVTPAELISEKSAVVDTADPFAALPLISEFHQQKLQAILHRNGITRELIEAGYFFRDPSVQLEPAERAFYESLGIRIT